MYVTKYEYARQRGMRSASFPDACRLGDKRLSPLMPTETREIDHGLDSESVSGFVFAPITRTGLFPWNMDIFHSGRGNKVAGITFRVLGREPPQDPIQATGEK